MIITTTNDTEINKTENYAELEELNQVVQQQLSVSLLQHDWRLDKFLAESLDGLSRHYLQQLIKEGAVSVAGQIVKKVASKVKQGQCWKIEIRPPQQSQAFVAQDMALEVVYQDSDIIVINKPADLVVHPAPGNWRGTLLNALLWHFNELKELPRAGIVHRLDKDTSGLMVVARHRQAMDKLARMIAAREVSRQYLAVVARPWQLAATQLVEKPLGRDVRNRTKMAVVDLTAQHGKVAKTKFSLVKIVPPLSLLHCQLFTGRTHQIRVHLSYLGYPILADVTYGGSPNEYIARQALHAWRLAFKHPLTAQEMCFFAPIPADWQKIMALLAILPVELLKYTR